MLRTVAIAVGAALLGGGAGVEVRDLDGHVVRPISNATTVFLFTRTDCPISNRYAPEIRRLHDEFATSGIAFWLVYVDPKEPAEAIRRHMKEYGYPFGALVDARHELVKSTGATITPEAAVYGSGKLVYRGRIDDRYVTFGKARQSANVHDLEQVLADLRAGKKVEFRATKSVGCFIEDLR